MTWDKSDKPLEEKFSLLREKETKLELQLREIRQFQVNINSLKMIAKQEMTVNKIGEKSQNKQVTKHYPPKDNSGNDMNEKYRTSQKKSLLINIGKLLEQLD